MRVSFAMTLSLLLAWPPVATIKITGKTPDCLVQADTEIHNYMLEDLGSIAVFGKKNGSMYKNNGGRD